MSDIASRRYVLHLTLAIIALPVSACTPANRTAPPATAPALRSAATSDPSPSPAPTRTATPAPSLTPTLDPYWELTIPSLVAREYGGGKLVLEHEGRVAYGFDRATFKYEGDSLQIHAFAEIPLSEGPHPVVIVLHGYIDPEEYNTLTYTTRYADANHTFVGAADELLIARAVEFFEANLRP